ncbi:SMI1/KNR4 family protein [Pseudomonas syringae]|uniref:SMI1/KNR4 family protein n=1 Tax=Pseudomonas syringae TaxID=317 RepID=UPI003F74ED7D
MVSFTEKSPPAKVDEIDSTCKELGVPASNWLRTFWSECNGALLDDQILIYATDEILERNKTYEIEKNFPKCILIGDDSGGKLILIPKEGSQEFYFLDSGDPFIEDAKLFKSIAKLAEHVMCDESFDSKLGDIISAAEIKPQASDVLGIKKELGLNCSITALAKALESKGVIILKNVNPIKYEAALKRYEKFIRFS